MDRLKYSLIILICALLILSGLPISTFAAYPPEALRSLDNQIKMSTQEQWTLGDKNYQYRITGSDFYNADFMYESNWYVAIDKIRNTKMMMLMRPRSKQQSGRTFAQNQDVSYWAKAFNGNVDFVTKTANEEPTRIRSVLTNDLITRSYSRDIAKWSGAKVIAVKGLNKYDEAGLQLAEANFQTTPFPKASLSLPSTGKENIPFNISLNGEEFYPSDYYETREEVNYELSLDGTVLRSGQKGTNTFTDTLIQTKPKGTYTYILKVWDQVKRATTVKKTIVIGDAAPPPTEGGACPEPREVPKRYEYEMDLEVYRLDGRTAEKGTSTKTDVYVKRADFSSSRQQAKDEFNDYIAEVQEQQRHCEEILKKAEDDKKKAEQDKADAEKAKVKAQSDKAAAESAYASCQATKPDKNGKKPDCSGYSSQISAAAAAITTAQNKINEAQKMIEQKTKEIEAAKKMIEKYKDHIKKAQEELAYIGQKESEYSVVYPNVKLYFNDSQVSSVNVSLSEGEGPKRYTFPSWTLNNDGTIMAQINEDGPYNEFQYQPLEDRNEISLGYNNRVGNDLYSSSSSNNWKDTPIYISSHDTAACGRPENYFSDSAIEGVVRTINEDGYNRELKERVTSRFVKLPRDKMRAGFGFNYTVATTYENEDNEPEPTFATGTKEAHSFFPTLVNYLPYKKDPAIVGYYSNKSPIYEVEGYNVGMETLQPNQSGREVKSWDLPTVAVEEYSGNLFAVRNNDYLHHAKREPNEKVLLKDREGNVINKWFVDFTQPDGYYNFKVRTYEAGVNKLNTCQDGRVLVDGTIIGDEKGNDDFVKRSVIPENPFPAGTGWNWKNQLTIINNLTGWYRNWYEHPTSIPASENKKSFDLTIDKIREIKEYNKTFGHEIKLDKHFENTVHLK
ncbi:hypothetical protein [Bacillus sp. 1P06AnD]|uniref:hypothetical protein n=1 Tax=Bacillus sp. 1P06AnD TaxID=3132208 RepID=UPI0039A09133